MKNAGILFIFGLSVMIFITPALAADETYLISKIYEHNNIRIELDKVIVSDQPVGYSPMNFPPSEYRFVRLYYTLSNPTDTTTKYQFKMFVQDDRGREYKSDEFTLAEVMPAGSRKNFVKEYAVYRNSTLVQLAWYDMDKETLNDINTYIRFDSMATPTPEPTATPEPIVTIAPSEVPDTMPSVSKCLPMLPIAMVAGGFGGIGILIRRYLSRSR